MCWDDFGTNERCTFVGVVVCICLWQNSSQTFSVAIQAIAFGCTHKFIQWQSPLRASRLSLYLCAQISFVRLCAMRLHLCIGYTFWTEIAVIFVYYKREQFTLHCLFFLQCVACAKWERTFVWFLFDGEKKINFNYFFYAKLVKLVQN